MANYSIQRPSLTGYAPTYSGAAAADNFAVGSDAFLIVRNGGGSPCTVTFTVPSGKKTFNGGTIPNTVISVPATTGERWILLDPQYADPADGLCHVTFSPTASVTHAAVSGPLG